MASPAAPTPRRVVRPEPPAALAPAARREAAPPADRPAPPDAGAPPGRAPPPPPQVSGPRRPPSRRRFVSVRPRGHPELTDEEFDLVRRLVYAESAIVLEPGKEYLVESRLLALARRDRIPGGIAGILSRLAERPKGELARQVVEAITTNETSFFRDQEPFEVLREVVLPDLVRRRAAERQLRIWCAASSSGQEPYSVAMLLRESFPQLDDWRIQLTSSDLSREMLRRCDDAWYTDLEVDRGLSPERRARHFLRDQGGWRARPELRQRVQFFELNLAGPWPAMAPMDLVLMRNVLIYFDVDTKKAILGKLRQLLRPDGYLFLGGAETTFSLDDGFVREATGRVTYYRLR